AFDDVYSEKSDFFDPQTYFTIKHIVANFASRALNKKRILSNAVNYTTDDATQTYLMKKFLTSEQRRRAINLLKDKKALESYKYDIPDDNLLAILLTKQCEVRDGGKLQ